MKFWPFSKKPEPTPVSQSVPEEVIPADTSGHLSINAITYDEKAERIRVDMDWDEEFVSYLKRHGFTGATDEAIVQKYVATLYRNVIDDLSAEGKAFE